MKNDFLPISRQDMERRGWKQADFILVTADAYVDHPSFANAIISRVLESEGYKVGLISQPDWNDRKAFQVLGTPKYAFLVSGGNIDSMVNHYTVSKKRRNTDSYSPGGKAGLRPDRPTIVYCNKLREAFSKDIPIVIGGIEASLRRFAHYDYWQDKVRRSILCDSQANLLSYGMGERSIVQIAERLRSGILIQEIRDVAGTCYLTKSVDEIENKILLSSFDEIRRDKRKYAMNCRTEYEEQNPFRGKILAEEQTDGFYLVQNPPQEPLGRAELDRVYSLKYQRAWHPVYDKQGGVPAIEEVKFSVISERGCFGACNFCALAFHQGRVVTSRSHQSIVTEVKKITHDPDFKGYIHDVGGPTANFRMEACEKQKTHGACKDKQCLYPKPCKNLRVSHRDYLELLRKIKQIDGVKKVFIRSGIRFDYLLADKDDTFFRELVWDHVSGQLKVAPEHCSDNVLKRMGKPEISVYNQFKKKFFQYCSECGKEQYLVPYLMSSHPGSTLKDAVRMAEFLRDSNYQPEQVQDFYPTPGTISTCMYYTGLDPRSMEKVYVPRSYKEKQMQRALLQYRRKENYQTVKEALTLAGRTDLIGFDSRCLIRPQVTKAKSRKGWKEQKSSLKQKSQKNQKNIINHGRNTNENHRRKSSIGKGKTGNQKRGGKTKR